MEQLVDELEILSIISRGEDSQHQFKENITNGVQIASEMAAFANSKGGYIFIGVDDDGAIKGLTEADIRRINNLISSAAADHIRDPLNPITENKRIGNRLIVIVRIEEGNNKPYLDNDGVVWVKNGANKRKVTSKEELRRIFQSSDLIHSDEVPIANSTTNDLDREYFSQFYNTVYNQNINELGVSINQLLENLNLASDNKLNLAGLLNIW